MILTRLRPDPGVLVDFFQEALESLGAVCERSWHDRLHLVAEGRAARLWKNDDALHETELHFVAPESTAPRDAGRDIFPGCPLTFRLAECLLPDELAVERAVLAVRDSTRPPTPDVAQKLWRAQWPGDGLWRLDAPFRPTHHFSLVALIRGEIQAIDQHWSLHRLAIALPGGERDESLAAALDFAELTESPDPPPAWPACHPVSWQALLDRTLAEDLATELSAIRSRQERYLRRELDRIDAYFEGYARELRERARPSRAENAHLKREERLAAARAEHTRRRADQVQRHEVRVLPRLDALLLVGEPAWETTVTSGHRGEARSAPARLVPRARRWFRTHL